MNRTCFAVGFFAALVCSSLQAQTRLQARIPFEFRMGPTSFAAGDYDFRYSTGMLTVHQKDGDRTTAMGLTVPVSRAKPPETGIVEFRRYGDYYFLSEIWAPWSPDGGALPKTAREKELARRSPAVRTETIVLESR